MASRYDITIDQGTDWLEIVEWADANESPINLTGYTAALTIKREIGDVTTVLELTSSPAAGLVITAAEGRIEMSLTDTQTAALSGVYWYNLRVTSPAGVDTRLLEGEITLNPRV